MTAFLSRLLGRLPVGWLQLTHSKGRLAVALAGVAFANVLVFVQLGILGGMNGTINLTYKPLNADILISSSDTNTLLDGSPLARTHMFRALTVPGVAMAAPLYLASVDWERDDGTASSLQVYGIAPENRAFLTAEFADGMRALQLPDTALLDRLTRNAGLEEDNLPNANQPLQVELNGLTVSVVGTLAVGPGLGADGTLLVSDQTFLRLFAQRVAGTPSHILVQVEPGYDLAEVSQDIVQALNSDAVIVNPLADALDADITYQTTVRPTGLIFGFGVVMGIIVGVVIVYQVLATDVADHLREYATFKAMGYRQSFFLSIVFEEAVIMAVLGFVPGLIVSWAIYSVLGGATGLPIEMDFARASSVLIGTILACAISGAIATRRLAGADPADLF